MKNFTLVFLLLIFSVSAIAQLPARQIQFRRGLCADLPTLSEGEPGYCTDTQEIYIGSSSGNILVYPPVGSGSANIHLSNLVTPMLNVSLDFNSHKGLNLLDPTSAQDAATKNYVDSGFQGDLFPSGDNTKNIGKTDGTKSYANALVYDVSTTWLKVYSDNPQTGAGVVNNMGGFVRSNSADNADLTITSQNASFGSTYGLTVLTGHGANTGYGLSKPILVGTGGSQAGQNTGTAYFKSGVPGSGGNSGDVVVGSGDASSGNSGNVMLLPGTASGTRGIIDATSTVISNVTDPTLSQDAATKNYVDTSSLNANYLLLTGGTMSGALDLGSNLISNVADPVSAQDAATKNYVDAHSDQDISVYLTVSTGALTGIVANEIVGAGKAVRAQTIENVAVAASALTCTGNPTFTLFDCGTTPTSCTSGTITLATVTISAANTITNGTISSSNLPAGHYWAWEITAGTCGALNATGNAEATMQ